MTKLELILERLPSAQRQQVEALAAQLLEPKAGFDERRSGNRPNRIQLDKLQGMLNRSGVADDAHFARDAWADAAED